MKTPEEILDQYLENYPWIYSGKENAIKAMELYAKLYYDSEVKKLNEPAVSKRDEVERGGSVCCTKCGKTLKPIYMCTDCIDVEMQKKLKQTDC